MKRFGIKKLIQLQTQRNNAAHAAHLQEKLRISFKWATKGAIVAYPAGFVVLNVAYWALWRFLDFNISSTQCVLAIFLFAAILLISTPLVVILYLVAGQVPPPKRWSHRTRVCFGLVFALALLLQIVMILNPEATPKVALPACVQLHLNRLYADIAVIFLFLTVTLIVPVGTWRDWEPGRKIVLEEWVGCILAFVPAIFGVVALYFAIPSGLGGGAPESEKIWLSDDAIPIVTSCQKKSTDTDNGSTRRDDFVLRQLNVIHNNAAEIFVMCDDGHTVLRLSRSLLAARQ